MLRLIHIMLFILALAILSYPQNKMSEQDAINKSHIDFSVEEIYFVLHGYVEIDGHTFYNDKDGHIIFRANLDGISIIDTSTNTYYTHRKCNKKGCKVIHLVERNDSGVYTIPNYQWNNENFLLTPDGNAIYLNGGYGRTIEGVLTGQNLNLLEYRHND